MDKVYVNSMQILTMTVLKLVKETPTSNLWFTWYVSLWKKKVFVLYCLFSGINCSAHALYHKLTEKWVCIHKCSDLCC